MKFLTTIFAIIALFTTFAQSKFVVDFGASKGPMSFFGINEGIQINDTLFGLATTSRRVDEYKKLQLFNASGDDLNQSLGAPSSWSGGSYPYFYKLQNTFLQSSSYDTVGGAMRYLTQLYNVSANVIWSDSNLLLRFPFSLQQNEILAVNYSAQAELVQIDARGAVLWSISIDSLNSGTLSDSILQVAGCGFLDNKYWVMLSNSSNSENLFISLNNNQQVVSKKKFTDTGLLEAFQLGNRIVTVKTNYATGNPRDAINHSIDIYDSNFNSIKSISYSANEATEIIDVAVSGAFIYLLVYHITLVNSSKVYFTEVQKLDKDGNQVRSNLYRFWLNHKNEPNVQIGQNSDFRSLHICNDGGYLMTGYIGSGYDQRTVAIKLDSNGLGDDTLKIPVDRMPLIFWDRDTISADTLQVVRKESIANTITVFPNPAHSELFIQHSAERIEYKLFESSGSVVFCGWSHEKIIKLNTTDFQDGIYWLQLRFGDNSMVSKRVIISK